MAGVRGTREFNPDWSNKDLAEHLKLSEPTITKYQAPSRCTAEVQNALLAGKLGITAVYEISRVPADQQSELLKLKLSGTSRDQLAQAARKSRSGSTPAVKLSKIRIAMRQATVVITGADLGMAEVMDLLAEMLKEAQKGGVPVRYFDLAKNDERQGQVGQVTDFLFSTLTKEFRSCYLQTGLLNKWGKGS